MTMTRRQRLMATLEGKAVDRPAVSFYEIEGYSQRSDNPSPFNIHSHPSWKSTLELAANCSDRIIRRYPRLLNAPADPAAGLTTWESHVDENGSQWTTLTIRAGSRTLTQRSRRDRDVDTVWTVEHLLKDEDDLDAYLSLPEPTFGGKVDATGILADEQAIGDSGIVMIDTGDPLCAVASRFDMGTYTVIALTNPELVHRALEREARWYHPLTEAVAKALPGRLWRIYGPEFASPPYLPPRLFAEYAMRYTQPMIQSINRHGGYPRVHSHGRLRDVLGHIAAAGAVGLDPVEPPPQGDVSLQYVRENFGRQMVLFGNLEASDLENLPADQWRAKVQTALDEGAAGEGRGFVLMPSACPYGRVLGERAKRNYEIMIEATR